MPEQTKALKDTKTASIEIVLEQYFDGLSQGNQNASRTVFRDLSKSFSDPEQSLEFLRAFSQALQKTEDLSDKAIKQLDKDMVKWFDTVRKSITDYEVLPLLHALQEYPRLVPAPFAKAIEDSLREKLPSASPQYLMASLLLRAKWGQTTADDLLSMAVDYDFVHLWYQRFVHLNTQTPDVFNFKDIADLLYCCGELRIELEPEFSSALCNSLRYKIVAEGGSNPSDIVRAIHAMAMIDATEQDKHTELKKASKALLTHIENTDILNFDDQRLLYMACEWFNLEHGPALPKKAERSQANQSLHEKFEAQRENSEIAGQELPEKKVQERAVKLKDGQSIDATLRHFKNDSVPQTPHEFGAAFNLAASTNVDVPEVTSAGNASHPIHIIADDILNVRRYIARGTWRHDDKWVLKGTHYLESVICSKVLGGPVLHVRGNELNRLMKLDGSKFAEAVGEYTWDAMPNTDGTQLSGSHDVVQKHKEYVYQQS